MKLAPTVVIAPVFEDLEAASQLFRELAGALGPDIVVVAVDDGSVRQPLQGTEISDAGLDGAVLRLVRNVGHQRAIAIGVNYAAEHWPESACVVMDSDGEDVPATAPVLLSALADGNVDVAVARRRNRAESLTFRAFYAVYKVLFSALSGHSISFGNFMALTPFAARRLAAMPEVWVHVASSVLISRLRVAFCPIDRGPRYAGQSKMNFAGLVLHGLRALMVFAEDVLVRVGLLCAAVSVLSIAAIALASVLKLIGLATPGWFSVAMGILILVLLQTGTLTLITLMLSGVVRSNGLTMVDYRRLIGKVIEVHGRA